MAARLTPSTLNWRIGQAKERLEHVRLVPGMLKARLDRAAERLAAGETTLRSLDPRAPLKRGYAMVFGPEGDLVRTAEGARRAGRVELEFADGRIAATTGSAPPPAAPQSPTPAPRTRKASPPPTNPKQGDLF